MVKKCLALLSFVALLASCSTDVDVFNMCGGHGSGSGASTPSEGSSDLIINVGDSKYGMSSRSVVGDDAVNNGADQALNNAEIYTYNKFDGKWEELEISVANGVQKANVPYGSTRGCLYGETFKGTPYANGWFNTHGVSDGKLTLSTKEIEGDEGYYLPPIVTFWGNYELAVNSTEAATSYEEKWVYGTSTEKNPNWELGEVSHTTKSAAISRNIQYATSVLKPTIIVRDKVTVWADNGKTTKEVDRDDIKFSVQYFYVESSKEVVYCDSFKYTPSDETVTYKYALKDNGVFGKVENNADVFDSWGDNYANLSILPTSKTSVRVVLVCKYFGNDNAFYVYDSNKKQYSQIKKGTVFYVYGNMSVGETTTVSNKGNILCPTSGASGVFIPDVKTIANITIDKLADKNKSGEDDPVVIDPTREDVQEKFLYHIDATYGQMDATWIEGK